MDKMCIDDDDVGLEDNSSSNCPSDVSYFNLNYEISKINALTIFKDNLIKNIIKYFRFHGVYEDKKIEKQLLNQFPNWFFKLNIDNKIKEFLPIDIFDIQYTLDYTLSERNIIKKNNFDPRLLKFDYESIKNNEYVKMIHKKQVGIHVIYTIETNFKLEEQLPLYLKQHKLLMERFKKHGVGMGVGIDMNKFDEFLCILLKRYKFLGGIHNHLSVPKPVNDLLNIQFELFGTPLNTRADHFCSPFPDYEKYFGSHGSMFDYKLQSGVVYSANPPFDEYLICKMIQKLMKEIPGLHNTEVYMTSPNWVKDFPALDALKASSKLVHDYEILNNMFYPYYNYYTNKFVVIVDTVFVSMGSPDRVKQVVDFSRIKPLWYNIQKT